MGATDPQDLYENIYHEQNIFHIDSTKSEVSGSIYNLNLVFFL